MLKICKEKLSEVKTKPMILIKENYTLIKIKRIVLIISVFFNCFIIIISIFGAYKYYTRSHRNKPVTEYFPEKITFEILHESDTGVVISSREFFKTETPPEFINKIVLGLNEWISKLDEADGPYFIRMSSNGKIIKTNMLINDTSRNSNTIDKKQLQVCKKKEIITINRELAISKINQITLAAH